jgi:PASTA domain
MAVLVFLLTVGLSSCTGGPSLREEVSGLIARANAVVRSEPSSRTCEVGNGLSGDLYLAANRAQEAGLHDLAAEAHAAREDLELEMASVPCPEREYTADEEPDDAGVVSPPGIRNLKEVPNLIGKTSAEAQALVESMGFQFMVLGRQSSDEPSGTVVEQIPEPGEGALRRGHVGVTLSSGPRQGGVTTDGDGGGGGGGVGEGGGGGGNCDPSYPSVCIPPPPPDLDCAQVNATGFEVTGSDPHGFDGDGDGVGCET